MKNLHRFAINTLAQQLLKNCVARGTDFLPILAKLS